MALIPWKYPLDPDAFDTEDTPVNGDTLVYSDGAFVWSTPGGGAGIFSGAVAQNYVAIGADAAGTKLSNTVMYHAAGPLLSVLGGLHVSDATALYSTLNVGGLVTFSNNLGLLSTGKIGLDGDFNGEIRSIKLRANYGADEVNAGTIAYRPLWDTAVLGIVGAGAGGDARQVRIWDTLSCPSITVNSNFSTRGLSAISDAYFQGIVDYSWANIGGVLNVGGATKISNALAVSDATTLYSTLNVGGLATFSGAAVFSSTVGIKGALTLSNKNISDDTGIVLSFGSGKVTKIGDVAPANGNVLTWSAADVAWVPKAGGGGAGIFSGAVTQKYIAVGADADGTLLSNSSVLFSSGDVNLAAGANIMVNAAKPYRSIILAAGGGFPSTSNGCSGPNQTQFATNKTDLISLDFSNGQYAEWQCMMPDNYDGGTLDAIFYYWCNTNAASPIWLIQGTAYGDAETIDTAWGTAQSVADAVVSSTVMYISSNTAAITLAGTPAGGEMVKFRVMYSNFGGLVARLIGVKLQYQVSAFTD